MNEALQRWREDFAREPDTAFDRLVRGIVPLGGASQLSFGEILDALFEPGDAALDTAAAGWLEKRILGPVPENTSLHRWVSVLEEFFRGIAAMELPQTGEILRRQHKRLRLWLHGFYEGPDRDPEGAYLIALARAQDDQRFSPLWRRLILGEELAGRPYLGIGILGFRKKPEQASRESSGVPEGLLQALVELADKPGTAQAKWKQTMRSLFATYRRSESYWVEHLAPLLPHYQEQSNARDWLSALLPGIPRWRPPTAETHVPVRKTQPVPVPISKDWVRRVRQNPELCDTQEFAAFLEQHRGYAESSGDAQQINLAFNNLSTNLIKADRRRAELAVDLMEEALYWAPWNPHNWNSYAIVLCAAHREDDAINALWEARQRFAWDPFIRNELSRILREHGDLSSSEGILREAVGHFPNDPVARNGLAETLRAMGRLEEAREVYKQACHDFPNDPVARNGLAETLRAMGRLEEAREVYEQACHDFPNRSDCRCGLAETLRAMGRLEEAHEVYEKVCQEFPNNAVGRTGLGYLLLALDKLEEAERRFREALEIDCRSSYARNGLAQSLQKRGAETGNRELQIEATRILRALADERREEEKRHPQAAPVLAGKQADVQRPSPKLEAAEDHLTKTAPGPSAASTDAGDAEPPVDSLGGHVSIDLSAEFGPATENDHPDEWATEEIGPSTGMSVAERLGRAMIALWQAERADEPALKSSLCADAKALLEISESKVEVDFLAAFVETRGLILLASGDAQKALSYFEEQIRHYGRGGWIGIQLGDQRARIALGVPKDADDTVEAPSSQSARFALYVARVIQTLSASPQESEVRELLKTLYPRAADFAARAQPDAEGGLSIESGAEMLGAFLQTRWFRPAGIQSAEDLDRPDALHAVVERINNTRTDTFDVISNSTLAIAA